MKKKMLIVSLFFSFFLVFPHVQSKKSNIFFERQLTQTPPQHVDRILQWHPTLKLLALASEHEITIWEHGNNELFKFKEKLSNIATIKMSWHPTLPILTYITLTDVKTVDFRTKTFEKIPLTHVHDATWHKKKSLLALTHNNKISLFSYNQFSRKIVYQTTLSYKGYLDFVCWHPTSPVFIVNTFKNNRKSQKVFHYNEHEKTFKLIPPPYCPQGTIVAPIHALKKRNNKVNVAITEIFPNVFKIMYYNRNHNQFVNLLRLKPEPAISSKDIAWNQEALMQKYFHFHHNPFNENFVAVTKGKEICFYIGEKFIEGFKHSSNIINIDWISSQTFTSMSEHETVQYNYDADRNIITIIATVPTVTLEEMLNFTKKSCNEFSLPRSDIGTPGFVVLAPDGSPSMCACKEYEEDLDENEFDDF